MGTGNWVWDKGLTICTIFARRKMTGGAKPDVVNAFTEIGKMF